MVMVPEAILQRRLTFEDYLALPDDQDYEIVEGVLYVAPRARPRHQRVATQFTLELVNQVERPGRGIVVWDADLIVDERNTYVSPDVMLFLGTRAAQINVDEMIRTIPDLVVEVLSPTSQDYDRGTKRDTYERLGVRHYWIVDPMRQRVLELVLDPTGRYAERETRAPDPFRPALFPDLAIDLTRAFA
jgi:Uma2 family endonuclease